MSRYLITGGTGSVGKVLTKKLLSMDNTEEIIIISRSDNRQAAFKRELNKEFKPHQANRVKFVIKDIKDQKFPHNIFDNIDCVFHTAAMKHIDICEANPKESISTNVIGTENIITECLEHNVKTAVLLSTDKACEPSSTYGATKLLSERLFLHANSYNKTRFSVLRCGNIAGSEGSVIPFFRNLIAQGVTSLPITDERMCRFWLSLNEVTNHLIFLSSHTIGGEILIPKMPSFYITDLAEAMLGSRNFDIIGLRPAEKIEEIMFNKEESHFVDLGDIYIGFPMRKCDKSKSGEPFKYSTTNNDLWLTVAEIKDKLKEII